MFFFNPINLKVSWRGSSSSIFLSKRWLRRRTLHVSSPRCRMLYVEIHEGSSSCHIHVVVVVVGCGCWLLVVGCWPGQVTSPPFVLKRQTIFNQKQLKPDIEKDCWIANTNEHMLLDLISFSLSNKRDEPSTEISKSSRSQTGSHLKWVETTNENQCYWTQSFHGVEMIEAHLKGIPLPMNWSRWILSNSQIWTVESTMWLDSSKRTTTTDTTPENATRFFFLGISTPKELDLEAVLIVMSIHEHRMTIFPILNDEQMSNKVGVEHQLYFLFFNLPSSNTFPKANMTRWKIHHEWRCTVFPIENAGCSSNRHVSFQGCMVKNHG